MQTPALNGWTNVTLLYDPDYIADPLARYYQVIEDDKKIYNIVNKKPNLSTGDPASPDTPATDDPSSVPGTPSAGPSAPGSTPDTPAGIDPSADAGIGAFVERMYTVVLGRDAEAGGYAYWYSQLKNGRTDGAGLAGSFIGSAEFARKGLGNDAYIDVLYRTFFDREPDDVGRAYWLSCLTGGASRSSVLSQFVNSGEFSAICEEYGIARGTMEADGSSIYNEGVRLFVLRNYTKALGRAGEADGVEYWSHEINTGKATPLEVATVGFFHSSEFLAKGLDNAAYVEVLYQTFFDRASDEGGRSYWLSCMAGGMSRDAVLHEFAYSAEFARIMQQYGLGGSVSFDVESILETEAANEVTIRVNYAQTFARNEMFNTIQNWRADSKNWTVYGNPITYAPVKVSYDYNLERIAMKRAAEAAIRFEHRDLNGLSVNDRSVIKVSYMKYTENLCQEGVIEGQSNQELANAIMKAFAEEDNIYNQEHRKSFLQGCYDRVGIGVCNNGYCWYVAVIFGNMDNYDIKQNSNR